MMNFGSTENQMVTCIITRVRTINDLNTFSVKIPVSNS